MNTSRFFIPTLSALFFLSTPLFAKDAKQKAQKKELTREEIAKLGGFEPAAEVEVPVVHDVVADILIVSVPDTAAVGLIEGLKDPAKTEATARQIQSMVESKKARLVGWPNLQTRPGQRAVSENIQEVRYAIEFDRNAPAAQPGKDDVKGEEAAKAAEPPGPAAPAAVGVIPTAFETRNAGVTLEIETILDPTEKAIDAQLCAQHVQLLGWDPTTVEENGKTTTRLPQPRFHTNKVSTAISTESGRRHLIGVFRSGDNKDETELFLFRVTLKPRKGK